MKRSRKIAALAAALVMMGGLLAGCSADAAEQSPSTDLVVVALQGSNMPATSADLVEPYVNEAVSADTGSSFTLILADGAPFQAGHVEFCRRESLNAAHWRDEKEGRTAQCIEIIRSHMAQTPETDLLGALTLASRALRDGTADRKELVVVHNGIPTGAGPLSFIGGDVASLDENTIEDLVRQLKEEQAIPDLTGVRADWIYLGECVEPQQSVSLQCLANLQLLWETILKTSGVDAVTFKSTLPDLGAVEGAPTVTPVACSKQQTTLPALSDPVSFDSTTIGFSPDSAKLTDPAATAEYLAPYAEAIRRDARRYVLAGSTADTAGSTIDSSIRFGLERALSVFEILTRDLGVGEDLLLPVGIGNLPTSVRSDEDQKNRTVWLVAADSALGQELLDVGLAA